MLNAEIEAAIRASVLCWLATANASGQPNVSPKEVFAAYGKRSLLIANIASPNSVRNIRVNPKVCVSFVDVFVQKGYKLSGFAEIIQPNHPQFSTLEQVLLPLSKGLFPIHNIIKLTIQHIDPIMAPSYRLFPDITEAEQISSAMQTYGVKPAE